MVCSLKRFSVLGNTLFKEGNTGRVNFQYITFRNDIMPHTSIKIPCFYKFFIPVSVLPRGKHTGAQVRDETDPDTWPPYNLLQLDSCISVQPYNAATVGQF